MKHSIKKLPKCTQEQLDVLLKLIARHVPEAKMVILYGSYARGSYVLWDERIEFGVHTTYQSDYDILLIVEKLNAKAVENKVARMVEDKYHRQFEGTRHAYPEIIVEHINTVNRQLEKGQYFFTDIVKEGIMLYTDGTLKLEKPRSFSYKEIKEIAQEELDNSYGWGCGFLRQGSYAFSVDDYRIASFELHQACEKFYCAITLVFTNYKPKCHRLRTFRSMTKEFSRELACVFPQGSEFEEECYDLLCRAYIEARYNKAFVVSRQQLEYMLARVEVLREVTYRICTEQIAVYDSLIEK